MAKKKGEWNMGKIKDRVNALLAKIKNDPDQVSLVRDMIDSCANYVDTVVNMENMINIYRFRTEDPAELRVMIQRLDQTRRIVHNAVISNVRIVDRLCRINNVEPVFGGLDEDRLAVAEFAKQVVDEFFEERKK
jgi:hypothetical protein